MSQTITLFLFALFCVVLLNSTIDASAITMGANNHDTPTRELRGAYFGVLAYDRMPGGFVCSTAPQVTYGVVKKDDPIFYDKNANYLFVRAANKDSETSWQLQIGILKDDLTYDVSLKNRGEVLLGGMYSPDSTSPYSNFGIILEPQKSAAESHYQLANYDTFLQSIGDDNYLPIGLDFSHDYTLEVVVFDSEGDWITSDKCAKKAEISISVSPDGVLKVGSVRISDVAVSDVTQELSPLAQYHLGVTKIKCKPGLVLARKTSDNTPSCLREETRLQLIERGWAKTGDVVVERTGILSGKISIGPLCPVEPCNNSINPYASRNLILQATKSSPIFVPLNEDGSFSAQIDSGSYVINLSKCSFLGCADKFPTTVNIEGGRTVNLDIDIDTGIR